MFRVFGMYNFDMQRNSSKISLCVAHVMELSKVQRSVAADGGYYLDL